MLQTFLYISLMVVFAASLLRCEQEKFRVTVAFPELSFEHPVDLQNAGDGTNRLFVVEQRGVISVFPNDREASRKKTFLDITERVDDRGTEEGLLGLAFHPDYQRNGYFFVNYTAGNPSRTVISRFQVSPQDPDRADPSTETVIITLPQPFSNHNAGQLAFGPRDGYLYITAGDGGSGGDPEGNGQNRRTLLGSILRIDVDQHPDGRNYGIPADNPFFMNNEGYREEIYAYGFRNPWRMSFDPQTGRLWVADVGQNKWEEIDIVVAGGNYGWNIMEGRHCFNPPSNCNQAGLIAPVWEYDHSQGISITGGYVYRGNALPQLAGKYIYADFGSGRIWALSAGEGRPAANEELLNSSLPIASFGVDEQNELYICSFDDRIYRLATTTVRDGQ